MGLRGPFVPVQRGIPTEDAAALFEPFFGVDRSKSKKTGSYGLGPEHLQTDHGSPQRYIPFQNNSDRGECTDFWMASIQRCNTPE